MGALGRPSISDCWMGDWEGVCPNSIPEAPAHVLCPFAHRGRDALVPIYILSFHSFTYSNAGVVSATRGALGPGLAELRQARDPSSSHRHWASLGYLESCSLSHAQFHDLLVWRVGRQQGISVGIFCLLIFQDEASGHWWLLCSSPADFLKIMLDFLPTVSLAPKYYPICGQIRA